MNVTTLPVTGRQRALRFYQEAKHLEQAFTVRLYSLETLLLIDPGAAWTLAATLALEAANLALFHNCQPVCGDLETVRVSLECQRPPL